VIVTGYPNRSLLNTSARCRTGGSLGPPNSERFGPGLELHRPHQADDAEDMIGVEMGEEDVAEDKRDAVAHHLSLGPFTAVEHQRFAFAHDSDGGHVALDRRPRRRRSEEAHHERHGRGI